jgi:hypothetical protein
MGSGFKTFTAASVLTAADLNNFCQSQSVMYFATTAARDTAITSPVDGMVAYIGSNDSDEGLYTYNGTSWRKGPGWNAPWGRVGSAVSSSNTTSVNATAKDVTSLSVSWTAVANRYYRTTVIIPVYSQLTTSGIVNLLITDGTPTTKQSINLDAAAGTDVNIQGFVIESNIATGSATRKARILTTAGSGTVSAASPVTPTIIVEDIGPSGAPA